MYDGYVEMGLFHQDVFVHYYYNDGTLQYSRQCTSMLGALPSLFTRLGDAMDNAVLVADLPTTQAHQFFSVALEEWMALSVDANGNMINRDVSHIEESEIFADSFTINDQPGDLHRTFQSVWFYLHVISIFPRWLMVVLVCFIYYVYVYVWTGGDFFACPATITSGKFISY